MPQLDFSLWLLNATISWATFIPVWSSLLNWNNSLLNNNN